MNKGIYQGGETTAFFVHVKSKYRLGKKTNIFRVFWENKILPSVLLKNVKNT